MRSKQGIEGQMRALLRTRTKEMPPELVAASYLVEMTLRWVMEKTDTTPTAEMYLYRLGIDVGRKVAPPREKQAAIRAENTTATPCEATGK